VISLWITFTLAAYIKHKLRSKFELSSLADYLVAVWVVGLKRLWLMMSVRILMILVSAVARRVVFNGNIIRTEK
jgi:hypothetical protein